MELPKIDSVQANSCEDSSDSDKLQLNKVEKVKVPDISEYEIKLNKKIEKYYKGTMYVFKNAPLVWNEET